MWLCITRLNNYCLTWVLMCLFIATTNHAQQVDEVSAEVQDYLDKVCNGSATCHLISRVPKNYHSLGVRNCMCDDQCSNYSDCCEDAPFKNSSQRENTTFECLKTVIDGHVYMVTSCPPSKSSSTSTVVAMCHERDPQLLAVDILLSTPVTNAHTGKTYRNVFCALCNDDKEIKIWDILVSYDGLLRALENGTVSTAMTTSVRSADDILNSIRPDDNDYFWRFKNQNTSLPDEVCYLNATIPRGLSTAVRPCMPNVINACAFDWIDPKEESVSRKCADNDVAYVSIGDKTYKNKFCAECNNVSVNSAEICASTRVPKLDATFYEPFVVNITDNRILKVPNTCSAVERSLPAYKWCRALPPVKTSLKKKHQCFPIRKDTHRPCLVAQNNIPKNSTELTFSDDEQFVIYRNVKYKFDEEFYNGSKEGTVYICGTYVNDPNEFLVFLDDILTGVLIKISIICLFLQLLVFQQLPEMRNLSGKNLASFSLTMMIFLISFDLGPRIRVWTGSCRVFGIVLHYTLLSCFAWMLVMSYDCWLSLYRATAQFRTSAGKGHFVRFAIYCLLCWSVPLFPVGYGAYIEYLSTDPDDCAMEPGYGLPENCFIFNTNASYYLFFIPASTSFMGNILFFAHTAYMIYLSQRKTVNPNTRNDFKLYTRLALMMGLTWTLGSLTTITGSKIVGLMFTIMNMSQGIFIFFGFTFKKKYIKLLLNKHRGNKVLTKTLSTFASDSTKVASENKTVSETV